MAAAWLLALAALPVAPVPASAQTEIWSATLTVEVTTALPISVGYSKGFFGALSGTDFVREGATYRVFDIFYYQQTGLFSLDFLFSLDAGLADTCGLVLELDNLELKFRDAEDLGGTPNYRYAWASSSLGWTDDQLVEVKLVVSDGSPCAPTGLTATAQNDRVALAWTAGGNGDSAITKHQVCRKEVSSFQFSCAATDWADIPDSAPNEANATSYTVRDLENGTEYAFRVRAVNEDGGGIASNDATATPMATAPDAPTGLTAEAGDESVTLRWTAGSDGGSAVTSHQYRRKTTGAFGAWQDIPESAAEEANAGSFTVSSGLTNDTAYTFEVQARNAEGESGPSNQAIATPVAGDTTAPMLRSATTTALEVGLTYDENLDGGSEPAPSAFTVTVDGASRAVTGVSVGDTKVLLTLAPAVRAGDLVRVSYTVPAMNPLRDEANNPAAAFADHPVTNEVPATVPDAPSSLAATPGDGSVTLRWTASAYDGGSEVTSHRTMAEDDRRLRVLGGHRGQRGGRGERDQLPGDEPHATRRTPSRCKRGTRRARAALRTIGRRVPGRPERRTAQRCSGARSVRRLDGVLRRTLAPARTGPVGVHGAPSTRLGGRHGVRPRRFGPNPVRVTYSHAAMNSRSW